MRKTAAILLFILLFFNWYGYRIAISLLQKNADHQLESLIDNNEYKESELIEIRVALNMPYQERYTDFERHYGEITVDGKIYTYVKRKIEGDMLVLKCIANHSKQQLRSSADDFAKSNSDMDKETQGKKQSTIQIKAFNGDWDDETGFYHSLHLLQKETNLPFEFSSALTDVVIIPRHQPPRII